MFFVFSKEKIYTYIVSTLTIIALFFVASNNSVENKNSIETFSKNEVDNLIYNEIVNDNN